MPMGNHKLSHYMPAKVEMKTRRLKKSVMMKKQVWLLFCPSLVFEWSLSCATGSPEKVLEDAYGPGEASEAQWGCVTCAFLMSDFVMALVKEEKAEDEKEKFALRNSVTWPIVTNVHARFVHDRMIAFFWCPQVATNIPLGPCLG